MSIKETFSEASGGFITSGSRMGFITAYTVPVQLFENQLYSIIPATDHIDANSGKEILNINPHKKTIDNVTASHNENIQQNSSNAINVSNMKKEDYILCSSNYTNAQTIANAMSKFVNAGYGKI